jgi:hypothetical protein
MFCFVNIFDDDSRAMISRVNEHFDVADCAVMVIFCVYVMPVKESAPEVI